MKRFAWLKAVRCLAVVIACSSVAAAAAEDEWPALPELNGAVEIPGQEWHFRPGPRRVRILVHYPRGNLGRVTPATGIMLTLHNWGGTDCVGTASPTVLADTLNVVAVCVNYLQSGQKDSIEGPEPYDCGFLQALDALRALWYVGDALQRQGIPFAADRLYCTGGSGGGNVTLMANKLAPRTFACVVDVCGMKKLSDDIAFALPGGSDLDARWSRDPVSPRYLRIDEQEIRCAGHPDHLAEMKRLGATARVVIVHGVDDNTCPFADADELASLMEAAQLPVEPHFITAHDLDGTVFTSTGHALGDRTKIVLTRAGKYLKPDSQQMLRREAASDFERREAIRYATSSGTFVIDYALGYPISRFEPALPPPDYSSHHQLLRWIDAAGTAHNVRTVQEWEHRREHIRRHLQRVMGLLPSPLSRVPLNPIVSEEVRLLPPDVKRPVLRRKLTYQSDSTDRVPAILLIPLNSDPADQILVRRPAVLCLQQTTTVGKDEPAGIRGDPSLAYALELAERGFVTLSPDYPSFGEHVYDFAADAGYGSGSMKAVWDNIRAVDLLESLPEVDAGQIGCIGHSLGGHNAIFTAVFEPRLRAIVSSCGFTSLAEDDIPSWTGPRYMPRIASQFGNDAARVPFDFHELIAAIAPRAFLACAAEHDSDFAVSGVRHVMKAAATVYALSDVADALQLETVDAPHSFPEHARKRAYEFLEQHLSIPPR